ncbi:hypothetical protein CBER1_02663 [Cercospora berteroae]|uniref:Uncharacterized protein n=1 Tax=Cercospora berteroae TaxID=357750 RepID=A0A2S6CJT2_9PEZI|nr:hypothetical protein CBER1_02663 [Cercospora berteroae]
MLQSLRCTAEAFTEVEVQDIVIVLPGLPSSEMIEATKSAAFSIGLRLPVFGHSCAPSIAIYANRWAGLGHGWLEEEECYKWQERSVLAVDYSRAALTGVLYAEDCFGLLEGIRGIQDTNLGKDAAWSKGDGARRASIVEVLRQLVRLPVVTDQGNVLNHIHGITLSGEAGYDKQLRSVLKEFFQSEMGTANFSVAAMHDTSMKSETMVDPLFAGAMGSAAICWERLEWYETTQGRLELR